MARSRTAAELRLMTGPPPFAEPSQVSLANWQDPPFNRWSFQHVRDLVPTARIRRGDGPVWRFPRAERDLSGIRFRNAGRELTVGDLLDRTWTDGFIVLHRGRVGFTDESRTPRFVTGYPDLSARTHVPTASPHPQLERNPKARFIRRNRQRRPSN